MSSKLCSRMNSLNRFYSFGCSVLLMMMAIRQFPVRVAAFSSKKVPSSRRWLTSLAKGTTSPSHSHSYQCQHLKEQEFPSKRTCSTLLFESIDDDRTTKAPTGKREWNTGGLQKEVSRLTVRCHKKLGKARERLGKANQEVERLTSDPNVSLEELERCPNIEDLKADINQLQTRLQKLNKLEVRLVELGLKGKNIILPEDVWTLAVELEVSDEPPQLAEKVSKKEKGPRLMESFRLPYRRYYTENKTEIRVGKQAEDNDELSLSPRHRDSADWWMHASGCPGSHIIIRSHDQQLDDEVVKDAAALAARQSKCTGNVIKVSMTRARDIKKPPGAKAGLVQLTGQVRTVSVNMKEAQVRLDRLDKTVLVN